MADQIYQVEAGTLPEDVCNLITDEQSRLDAYAAALTVTLPGSETRVVRSATKPADVTVIWAKVDQLDRLVRFYVYANGSWISPHPLQPGHTMIWTTTLPDFNTFDGGSGGAVTTYAGPMWEEVTALRAAFPMGVGTLPTAGAIAVAATGGAEKVTLTAPQLPSHTHEIGVDRNGNTATAGSSGYLDAVGDVALDWNSGVGPGGNKVGLTRSNLADNATVQAHDNMPPYVAVYFLRRTAKLYYVEA